MDMGLGRQRRDMLGLCQGIDERTIRWTRGLEGMRRERKGSGEITRGLIGTTQIWAHMGLDGQHGV